MKVYTHATVGVTTTLFISKLLNAGVSPDLIISLIVGVLGGIIPDVDLPEKNDSVSKKSKKKRIIIILIVSVLLMILFWKLSEDIDFVKLISSIIIFIAFIFIFTKQPHRHFSHSILGIGIIVNFY